MELIHVLLVYPKFPLSYWGFQYALRFVGKKSSMPPLGLITVAGMFPDHYELKLVDMNVEELTDAHLEWAHIVFTSTMVVQQDSLRDVVRRCNNAGVSVVAGGPYPTSFHEEMDEWDDACVNYFVLGEVEETLPSFLKALEAGKAERFTRAPIVGSVSVARTPVPRFDLLPLPAYGSMVLQFSRGCPFDCEFCDITKLYGRIPRTKSNEQMLA
ncbi:MAG: cobalamin-dependent protein, partial [Candidatus Wolfebacteria bacterium]|nr:cobalamin-dependent protein [Candidatus Wolfebacteria bacterium]